MSYFSALCRLARTYSAPAFASLQARRRSERCWRQILACTSAVSYDVKRLTNIAAILVQRRARATEVSNINTMVQKDAAKASKAELQPRERYSEVVRAVCLIAARQTGPGSSQGAFRERMPKCV